MRNIDYISAETKLTAIVPCNLLRENLTKPTIDILVFALSNISYMYFLTSLGSGFANDSKLHTTCNRTKHKMCQKY